MRDDDPLHAQIKLAHKGVVICNVCSPTTQWPDAINQDLDDWHVNYLKKIFESGIYHTVSDHRMKASMTQIKWESLTSFLVEGMQCGVESMETLA